MTIQPKTTYRRENDSGQTEIRKAFSVERSEVKVWKEENDDGTEITYIEVPVSSPSEDRDGDEFSEEGVESQMRQFQSGEVGMWLDHGLSAETGFPDYRVLEQIGGWKDATVADDGQLKATAALRPSSEDAKELESMLDEGVAPVGFSVGFIVERAEDKEDSEHGMVFHEVDLLECSAVGIPSNPDAMVSDSAMAAAKGVAESGAYEGDAGDLARAMTREMRSLPYVNEQRNTMQGKQSDSEYQSAIATIESYIGADGSEDDPVTEVIDWASETEEANAEAVEAVAQSKLETEDDADSLDDLSAMGVMEFASEELETEEEGSDGEEGEEEEESGEVGDGKSENDPPELRSAVKDALDEVLLDALTDEEALRSLISEEVRDTLAEEEFDVEVTDSFVEELRSELFKNDGDGDSRKGPSPAGTISTYEPEEENSGDGENGGDGDKNNGGSGNASKPSPAIGGN